MVVNNIYTKAKQATAVLIDAMGRIVKTMELNEQRTRYDLVGLTHGLYTLTVYYPDGSHELQRIRIE